MKRTRSRKNHAVRLSLSAPAALLASSAFLYGCSGDTGNDGSSYEYAIPDNLCGIKAESTLLKELLVPGDAYETEVDESIEGMHECRVFVDSKRIAYVRVYMLSLLDPPPRPDRHNEHLESINIEGDALLWDRGAGVSFRCIADDESLYAYPNISMNFFDTPIDDDEERKDAIEAFARSYVEGVKEYQRCDYA
ncbi:hypothetical protein ACFVUW_16345 [Streptomyces xiamenensis]|uniref:hypothetical protein n=1 Tax=Streptomyces xiamenensis TaxID=408015 RepID=UPI0036F136AC